MKYLPVQKRSQRFPVQAGESIEAVLTRALIIILTIDSL